MKKIKTVILVMGISWFVVGMALGYYLGSLEARSIMQSYGHIR